MFTQAVTPILMFFIFGAQEEVFEAWASCFVSVGERLKHTLGPTGDGEKGNVPPPPPKESENHIRWSTLPDSPIVSKKQQSRTRDSGVSRFSVSSSEEHAHSYAALEQPEPVSPSSGNTEIALGSPIRKHSGWEEQMFSRSGLRPPPRPHRGKSESMSENGSSDTHRGIGQMPSLTSIGSVYSSWPFDDVVGDENDEVPELYSIARPRPPSRPDTGESILSDGTFG